MAVPLSIEPFSSCEVEKKKLIEKKTEITYKNSNNDEQTEILVKPFPFNAAICDLPWHLNFDVKRKMST